MLPAGTRLGPYEVRTLLGAGGMGEVYLGWDARLRREVAIKVLLAGATSDPERLRRFEQEARAAGSLKHPNVTAVYDIGSYDGNPYIVCERLEGETLRARLATNGLTPRKSLECAVQIARGLSAAHERGIIHRDLKPENIFLCTDGTVKILDFGIAKLLRDTLDGDQTISHMTEAGMVVGTAAYMSPEQVRGEALDPRSDIFAFGIVVYEMLAGRRPFAGITRAEVQTAILREDPAPLSTKAALGPSIPRIVMRCLEKRREDRFDTAKDVAIALDAAALASGETPLRSSNRGNWSRRTIATVATVMAIGALIGAGVIETFRVPVAPPAYTQLTFRRGTILGARFAPDGNTIVYSAAWDGDVARMFTTRVGGRDSRDLEMEGTVMAVGVNGELALQIGAHRRAGEEGTLAQVSLSGGAPRELLTGVVAADWDRDGRQLAVLRIEGERVLLEYPIGKVLCTLSGPAGGVRVLPDGRIAVSERLADGGDRPFAVSVVDASGSRQVLSAGWAEALQLAWSPLTSEILFAATSGGPIDLHAVSLSGRTRVVARVPGDFQLQDADRQGRLLMSRSFPRGGVLVVRPGDAQERDLSWLDFSQVVGISADGQYVLIAEIGGGFADTGGIGLRKTDGSPVVVLGEGSPLALSPDGRDVLALPGQNAKPDRLLVIPVGAGTRRELTHPSVERISDASWFPDGRRIVVAANRGESHAGLYLWDIDGTAPRVLAEGSFQTPVVSADGKWITARRDGLALARYAVEDGRAQPLPGAYVEDVPVQWSLDGESLFVRRGNTFPVRIERLEVATGKRTLWRELRPPEGAGVFGISSVVIAPDGKSYAYTFASSVGALYLAEGLR
jgi:Tol biopolymer transport system component